MVKRGVCSSDTLLNILLCLLGWFPGVIHCYYIIATYPEEDGPYIEIVDDNYGSV